ncbi:MAG: DUF2927 domain-containing protein, partial [Pseudomonadota bacterium]
MLAGCATAPTTIPDAALPQYYADFQSSLVARGLLRTETAPRDAPITLERLVESFVEIALYDEFSERRNRFVEARTASTLRRWEIPIRVGIVHGPSTSPAQAAEDRRNVEGFTRRLARLSGTDMALTREDIGNFTVMFLNRAEQRDFAQFLASEDLTSPAVIASFADSPPGALCIAYTFGGDVDGYGAAIIL